MKEELIEMFDDENEFPSTDAVGMTEISWNDGEIQTNYYGSPMERFGQTIGIAWHGGIDILIPRKLTAYDNCTGRKVEDGGNKVIREMRTGKYVLCYCDDSTVQFMFDDKTACPYYFTMCNEQFVTLPSVGDNGKKREIRIWAYNEKKGKVFKALTLPCVFKVKRNVA